MTTLKIRAACLGAAFLLPGAMEVTAQQAGDPQFDLGQSVFEENCAACHQPDGKGFPPNFPALDGNAGLADAALIVRQVRAGKKAMPAFPDLSAEEIAAVATYVRNAWSNDFGAVGAATAQDVLANVEVASAERTIWEGVYSRSQATNARLYYLGACAACHGSRLNGAPDDADMSPAPPLAGATFMREWEGRTLAALFEYMRTKMPIRNPGQLTDQQYADVMAYMLHYDDIPSGSDKLLPDLDRMSNILITSKPSAEDPG